MAKGSRGAQGRRAAPRRAGELRGAQKEPGGGEQMARSGKGTRRLAPGSFLDPLWVRVFLERRRRGGAVAGTQDR